jgi:hypothetical protein
MGNKTRREGRATANASEQRVVPIRGAIPRADMARIVAALGEAVESGRIQVERRSDTIVALIDWRRGRETLVGLNNGMYWAAAPGRVMVQGSLARVLESLADL